jgi:peptidoglycan-associated lipoprotein
VHHKPNVAPFMIRKYLILYISVALAIAIITPSCGSFVSAGQANKVYSLGEYTKAAELYKKAYSNEKNKYLKGEISFQMGECYRLTNKPSKAATAYARAIRTPYKNPLLELYLGQSFLKMGKPEDARPHFVSYLEKFPTDPLGHTGLKSCDMQLNPPKAARVTIEKPKEINSKYSDYSAIFSGGEVEAIYFSSMRFSGKRKGLNRITGQGPSKLFVQQKDSKGKWKKPEPIEEFAESTFDDGALCLADDGKELYFTRCRFDNTKILGAEVFRSKRTAGVWGEPELVPLSGDSLVSAHPAMSPDNLTLYFVSDKPEGKGGKDIWKVTRDTPDGEWGQPINLDYPVNTKGNELFPTVAPDGTLYFSSDGHAGLGGIDIFRLGKNDKDSLVAINVGAPINSVSDDFGMTFHPTEKKGMFTSSRDNTKGIDNIYNFTWRDVKLGMRGKVYDEKSKKAINGAYLRLVSADGTDKRIELLPDGTFSMELLPKTDYVFLVAAPGYFNRRQRFSTPLPIDDKEFVFDLPLALKVSPIMLETIYYQPSAYMLDDAGLAQMDRLAQLLSENPSVKIDIASYADASGNETDDIVLTQKRAQFILDYLTRKGIATERLSAKTFGSRSPLTVSKSIATKYRFLKQGDVLTPAFINQLKKQDKTVAQKLNHRTEFKVIE